MVQIAVRDQDILDVLDYREWKTRERALQDVEEYLEQHIFPRRFHALLDRLIHERKVTERRDGGISEVRLAPRARRKATLDLAA